MVGSSGFSARGCGEDCPEALGRQEPEASETDANLVAAASPGLMWRLADIAIAAPASIPKRGMASLNGAGMRIGRRRQRGHSYILEDYPVTPDEVKGLHRSSQGQRDHKP